MTPSTSANPQSADRNGDFIPIDEAARITRESVRTWRWRARREADAAERFRRDARAVKAPTPDGKGRSGWWVHRSLHDRLQARRETHDGRPGEPLAGKYPQHAVDRALRKHHWVKAWRKLCHANRDERVMERHLADRIVFQARRVEGDGFRISVRSLIRWWAACNGAGVEGLIDKHTGPSAEAARSPEAVGWFYELYHTQSKHPIRVCHDVTLREAHRQGWSWPASYSAAVAWLAKHDDLALTCLMRDGKDVWARKFLPHLETDESTLEPGALFVCDHHQCDWWCTYKGSQIRPWLSSVQDRKSRCIVGWHLGPTPHQDAILASLRMAFRDWAVPRVLRIDNGRDYTSQLITGVAKQERDRLRRAFGSDWRGGLRRQADLVTCDDRRWLGITGLLNIELIYSTPYAAWSKGTLERWFGTLEGQHGKTYATYCGNSAFNKPECLDEIRRGFTKEQKRRLRRQYGKDWKRIAVLKFVDQADVPTLDESRKRIGEYLDIYHRTKLADKFVTTKVAKDMLMVARLVRENQTMGLALGPTGIGKSRCAEAIHDKYVGSVYIRVMAGYHHPQGLTRAIAGQLGVRGDKGMRGAYRQMLLERVIETLRDSSRLLIIDEAHGLQDRALELLRDIHDTTGIPILMVATKDLHDRIRKNADPDRGQLYSRCDVIHHLTQGHDVFSGGKALYTLQEVKDLYDEPPVRLSPDAARYLQGVANMLGYGSLRRCKMLLRNAVRRARRRQGLENGSTVTVTADDLEWTETRLRQESSERETMQDRRTRSVGLASS